MKKVIFLIIATFLMLSCAQETPKTVFKKFDQSTEIAEQQNHENARMRFKLLQSHFLDMNAVFEPFEADLARFSEEDYLNLAPYLLEKDIPTIQESVKNRILSYEQIALFYLYRIRKFESDSTKALYSIITLNPNIIEEAREKDRSPREHDNYSLYGLPVLLKDNINTAGMPTTAGAVALMDNSNTDDAFIVKKLKEKGALILGKTNLSEWAYYFCTGCPLGYSAIGGQTLNPYGRKQFETGGSSSGSGVSAAANYAVVTVGTETSGSILSPSSKNAVVGLKPTIGVLSRTGIVPISSSFDTPGPMTKSVTDTAILLDAMLGEDTDDVTTQGVQYEKEYLSGLSKATLVGKRFGVMNYLLQDSIFKLTVERLKNAGAEIVYYDRLLLDYNDFRIALTAEMKKDLPAYISLYADPSVDVETVSDVVNFNQLDSIKRAPYNQGIFDRIVADTTSAKRLEYILADLNSKGRRFFEEPMNEYNLDAVLSINNYNAVNAAVGKFPCLTVPMGYSEAGEPKNLTFISKPFSEKKLIELGYAFEKLVKVRKAPAGY